MKSRFLAISRLVKLGHRGRYGAEDREGLHRISSLTHLKLWEICIKLTSSELLFLVLLISQGRNMFTLVNSYKEKVTLGASQVFSFLEFFFFCWCVWKSRLLFAHMVSQLILFYCPVQFRAAVSMGVTDKMANSETRCVFLANYIKTSLRYSQNSSNLWNSPRIN